jgi:hypothetical protein
MDKTVPYVTSGMMGTRIPVSFTFAMIGFGKNVSVSGSASGWWCHETADNMIYRPGNDSVGIVVETIYRLKNMLSNRR